MKFFRSQFLTLVLFVLVSIGQGYSFGYLYDLSVHSPSFGIEKSESSQLGKKANSLILCNEKWRVALSENPLPEKSHQEILSFRTEPFIPHLVYLKNPNLISELILENFTQFLFYQFSPETPPPKYS